MFILIKPTFIIDRLTFDSNILIRTATIGYGRVPSFEVQPPNAPTAAQQIAYALLTPNNPLRITCDHEGVNATRTAARILHPSAALNAPRTIEWEKIGADWKQLMEGGSVPSTHTSGVGSAAIGKSKRGFGGSIPGGVQKRADDIAKHVMDRVENRGGEGLDGLNAKIEEHKESVTEGKESSTDEPMEESCEDHLSAPDMKRLGDYLDKTRDMVKKRREELAGDEEKLTKARKAYPKVMEGLKKQFAGMRGEDGEIDLKKLAAMIPKEGAEDMQKGLHAGKEGIKMGERNRGKEEGMKKGKEGTQLEVAKKHIGKGGGGHNPEQLMRKKRDSKL